MVRMALNIDMFLEGLFTTIFVVLSVIIGLILISKYFEHKKKNLLLAGIVWIGISEPWWSSTVSFIIFLITQKGISIQLYYLIGNMFLPLTILCWLVVINDLLGVKRKMLIFISYIVFTLIFESILYYYFLTDISKIGALASPIDVEYTAVVVVFCLINLLIFCITGLLFAIKSLKSDNNEIKLKGKFLLIAFISFLIGATIDAIITLPISRFILMFSGITFYIGFLLPEWVKKRILK